jgi:PAS domain S-box-containing protein
MIRQGIFFLCFIVASKSLPAQLQVKNYFSFTGKKDISVNAIAQDNTGFLWIGTNTGLYRFDGRSGTALEVFSKKEITAVFSGKDQVIWVGTKAGKVYRFSHNRLDSLVLDNEEKITSFCELKGSLFIGTYGNGLYNYQDKKIAHYNRENGLGDDVLYGLTTDGKENIWCATDGGVTQITINTQLFFKVISDKTGLPDNIVRNVSLIENRLLISMQDSGVCYYNLAKNSIERIPFFNKWTLGTVLNARSEIPEKLTITTERNGIIVISEGRFSIYDYEKNIQGSAANTVFFDKTNQLWIGSKKGLSQLYSRRYDFINASKGLTDDKILALATDNDNSIWIGTTTGISKVMTNGEGHYVVQKIQDLTKYTISCAAKSPDGDIWFGTYGNGIIVLSPENNKSIIINSKDNALPNDNISGIHFTANHGVYISTLGGGLTKAIIGNDKNFKVEHTYTQAEGLGSDYVYSAITDDKGKLYVATDGGGLQVFENGTFTSLTEKYKLSSLTVFSLCKDRYNQIWATSNADGILKYNGKTLSVINAKNGLRELQPQQLVAFNDIVFAVNDKGVDKINCKDNTVSYYDLFEGDLEPNLNAIFIDGNTFYSGTNNGVLLYRASLNATDSLKPGIFIKSLQVNYKYVALDSLSEFGYNQNNMTFDFNGIWLKNPDKLSFRYQLKGFDGNWQYANEGKIVNYNNLSPGVYEFVVQSKNEEDVWSDEASYSFSILTPLWKRWWFWVLLLLVGGFGIYSFVKYRLRALQKENLLLEQRVNERTFEIEKQSKIIEMKNTELEQLSLVASRTDNVVLIMDAEGRLEYVNESFVKLNKITLEELKRTVGETIFEISNSTKIKAIVAEAVYYKKSVSYEALNKLGDGSEIWESSTLTPIFDEAGILKKIIIIDTDVTERKKQEQIIYQKNKDITDSISYARKIQHAILPSDNLIKKHLPGSFILYLTKDIVSGDFYWFTHINGQSIIAAVDCTGHGVPGAFMSLIGYNILNRIVNEQKITDPRDILRELNNGVLEALYKNESESKDGMDIAICRIDHAAKTLDYAGAMRPLWVMNKGVLNEIKADKFPIGTKQEEGEDAISYTTHTIHADADDTFYIFTDGYADQFGGDKDKKFSTRRFKDLVIKNHAESFPIQENNIKLEHQQWKGNNEQVDDILVIGFKL